LQESYYEERVGPVKVGKAAGPFQVMPELFLLMIRQGHRPWIEDMNIEDLLIPTKAVFPSAEIAHDGYRYSGGKLFNTIVYYNAGIGLRDYTDFVRRKYPHKLFSEDEFMNGFFAYIGDKIEKYEKQIANKTISNNDFFEYKKLVEISSYAPKVTAIIQAFHHYFNNMAHKDTKLNPEMKELLKEIFVQAPRETSVNRFDWSHPSGLFSH